MKQVRVTNSSKKVIAMPEALRKKLPYLNAESDKVLNLEDKEIEILQKLRKMGITVTDPSVKILNKDGDDSLLSAQLRNLQGLLSEEKEITRRLTEEKVELQKKIEEMENNYSNLQGLYDAVMEEKNNLVTELAETKTKANNRIKSLKEEIAALQSADISGKGGKK